MNFTFTVLASPPLVAVVHSAVQIHPGADLTRRTCALTRREELGVDGVAALQRVAVGGHALDAECA